MYCRNCGKEIPDDTKFCPECGTSVNSPSPVQPPTAAAPSTYQATAPVKVKKPFYKRWYFWVAAVFAVFISIGIFGGGGNGEYTAESSDYVGLSRSDYISQCKTVSYTDVARNPEGYKGRLFEVSGTVIQVLEKENQVQMRLREDTDNWEDDYVWYVFYTLESGEGRILEGDTMTVYGEAKGTVTYEGVLGNSITVPAILMKYHS